MPSPPPPYSPSALQTQHNVASPIAGPGAFAANHSGLQPSFRDVTSPATSSIISPSGMSSAMSPMDQNRISVVSYDSPRNTTPPAFPPPPSRSGRDRSISRHRPDGRSLLSGLSALTSRNRSGDQQPAPNAIDSLRLNTSEALLRTGAVPPPL